MPASREQREMRMGLYDERRFVENQIEELDVDDPASVGRVEELLRQIRNIDIALDEIDEEIYRNR